MDIGVASGRAFATGPVPDSIRSFTHERFGEAVDDDANTRPCTSTPASSPLEHDTGGGLGAVPADEVVRDAERRDPVRRALALD